MTDQRQTYGDWIIVYDPPPIPIRSADWQFYHKDYDGAPIHSGGPPADDRSGFGPTAEDCRRQIDEYEEDQDDDSDRWEYETQPPLSDREQAEKYHREEAANEEMNEVQEDD